MQPHSEISKNKQNKTNKSSSNRQQQSLPQTTTTTQTTAAAAAATTTTTTAAATNSTDSLRRNAPKLIKGKKPLCHFKFYLDIRDHQLTKNIEEQIKKLGGSLEFFLTPQVTHFITDKTVLTPTFGHSNNNNNNNNTISSRPGTPQTPATPNTPHTPCSLDSYDATRNNGSGTPSGSHIKTRQTRADAILNRARRQSISTPIATAATAVHLNAITRELAPLKRATNTGTASAVTAAKPETYKIWQTDYALHFLKRIQHELKDYIEASRTRKSSRGAYVVEPIHLKSGFIKIEATKGTYRPYYQLFKKPTEWPKVEITRDDGAFRLSPKKTLDEQAAEDEQQLKQKMTRKSRSRSSQRQHALPAAVQALKKCDTATAAKTSVGGVGGDVGGGGAGAGGGQRHSNMGAAACKQLKESSEKQCGVCEICKIEYDTLTIHLKTKDHEYFAKNSQNFIALDTLIHTSADVNQFLADNKKMDLKNELEEMEVEEDSLVDVNATDPLEDPLVTAAIISATPEEKRRSSGAHNTPSPTLREKSKRTTKGKHSSEKFQNPAKLQATNNKSPKTPPKIPTKTPTSPQKKTSSSVLELQRIESAPSTTSTRKKPAAAALSPPIRAMLPPSSLYKVVETPQDICTPPRKIRDGACGLEQATASPSLIVKFKKVRQAELLRLNGEAENFMFPKRRTSSELPTDVDRQTTSDNVRVNVSSASLDSSSELLMDVEVENIERATTQRQLPLVIGGHKKAIATAIRKSAKTKQAISPKQSFPSAPIQPEVQLKRLVRTATATTATPPTHESTSAAAAVAIAAATMSIILPEATRKSSRTATAIVTAATTSSRLLRAAVEAAKNNNRRVATLSNSEAVATTLTNAAKTQKSNSIHKRRYSLAPNQVSSIRAMTTATTTTKLKQKCRMQVGKMEDRMGDFEEPVNSDDDDESDNDVDEKVTNDLKAIHYNDDDDDDSDEEDDESDDEQDDDDDEDYVHSKKSYYKSQKLHSMSMPTISMRGMRTSTKLQRTPSQLQLLSTEINVKREIESEDEDEATPQPKHKRKKPKKLPSKKTAAVCSDSSGAVKALKRQSSSPTKKSSPQRVYDYTQSERLCKLRYAFERVPATDLWYRVFTRQDACEERYFQYFGPTKYRKLPYELGPVPFERTLDGVCCKFCTKMGSKNVAAPTTTTTTSSTSKLKTNSTVLHQTKEFKVKMEIDDNLENPKQLEKSSKFKANAGLPNGATSSAHYAASAALSSSSLPLQYTHKHKKLHLLQRYRQEQHELLQKQKHEQHQQSELLLNNALEPAKLSPAELNASKSNSKASTPDRERERERAGSTHSNTSSCASSSATLSKKQFRNKHLHKAAFLNLELPPRKSPREHASTLALVSCIIKQRQDSQSKPNSEIDEPPTTPTPTTPLALAPALSAVVKEEIKSQTAAATTPDVRSPRATRSAAATPVEELRFATEISENVKRMRRGQNKYDHSPPIVPRAPRGRPRGIGRPPLHSPMGRHRVVTPQIHMLSQTKNTLKRHKRHKNNGPTTKHRHHFYQHHNHYHSFGTGVTTQGAAMPSIRKTGTKKGVLEFEMDATALRALDAAVKHTNVRQLEWEIDKYLQFAGREFDADMDLLTNSADVADLAATVTLENHAKTVDASTQRHAKKTLNIKPAVELNTPPPTEYFSSDFDLYDLFTSAHIAEGATDDDQHDGKQKNFSLYNSVALNNYFRKRKSLKSNRTGWPKIQKKKTSVRQQQLRQKICFLQNVDDLDVGLNARVQPKVLNEEDIKDGTRESGEGGVITPPDSELDEQELHIKTRNKDEEEGDEDDQEIEEEEEEEEEENTELDAGESIPDDVETMADSIEDDVNLEADVDADADVEADVEEDDDEAEIEADGTADIDAEEDYTMAAEVDDYVPASGKTAHSTTTIASPSEKLINSLTAGATTDNHQRHHLQPTATATSTPSMQMMRGGLRRTPQLNGSLGSCISPSEKAGDNSDIFTVSSDGLETDLDMSNSHSQLKSGTAAGGGVANDDEQHHEHCPNHTPKRKFDLSKYAPNNATSSSSCAAEAATAAVKSLAISQFLKKEVRVQCRRLRAPFRRFRYRR